MLTTAESSHLVLILPRSSYYFVYQNAVSWLAGLWWGYILGIAFQNIFLFIFVLRLDWQKEADHVSKTEMLFWSFWAVPPSLLSASNGQMFFCGTSAQKSHSLKGRPYRPFLFGMLSVFWWPTARVDLKNHSLSADVKLVVGNKGKAPMDRRWSLSSLSWLIEKRDTVEQ